jgi:hypothetical protein
LYLSLAVRTYTISNPITSRKKLAGTSVAGLVDPILKHTLRLFVVDDVVKHKLKS